jgi:hypothetical protein
VEKRIFQEHFLEWTFIFDRETVRRFVVALLVDDGVDDVEEDFVVDLDRFRTNGTTQSADDFEHGITSSFCLYLINIQIPSKAHKKAPFE